jgi:hypothetical protein
MTILAAGAAAAWDIGRKRFAWPLLLLIWAPLAMRSARHIPIFMLVAAPAISRMAAELLVRLQTADMGVVWQRLGLAIHVFCRRTAAAERAGRVPLASLAAIAAMAVMLYVPVPPSKFRAEWDPGRYPARAIESLGQDLARWRVFTIDQWGDYLIYRFYPEAKVFIDGRSDFYGTEFEREYQRVMQVKRGWEARLERYGIDAILLPAESALAGALRESPRWQAVHQDSLAIVFRPAGQNGLSTVSGNSPKNASDRRITDSNERGENNHEEPDYEFPA